MNNVFSKFNIYDQIGYLMVGALAMIIVVFNAIYFYKFKPPLFTIDIFLVWFILTYFTGHLVQGFANIVNKLPLVSWLIKEDKEGFTQDEKEILEQVKSFFKLKSKNYNSLWNTCYVFSLAKDITGQVQSFDAYYSMYRGWLVIFLIESLFLFYLIISTRDYSIIPIFLFSLFSVLIFYLRSRRFWQYFRNKVLLTFIVVKTLK